MPFFPFPNFSHGLDLHFTIPTSINFSSSESSSSGHTIDYQDVHLYLTGSQLFIVTLVLLVLLLTILVGTIYFFVKRYRSRRHPNHQLQKTKSRYRQASNHNRFGSKSRSKSPMRIQPTKRLGFCASCCQFFGLRCGYTDGAYHNVEYESIAHTLDEEELDFKRQLEEQCQYEFGELQSDDEDEEHLDDEFSLEGQGYDYQADEQSGRLSGNKMMKRNRNMVPFQQTVDKYRQVTTIEEEDDEEEFDDNFDEDMKREKEVKLYAEDKDRHERGLDDLFDYEANTNDSSHTVIEMSQSQSTSPNDEDNKMIMSKRKIETATGNRVVMPIKGNERKDDNLEKKHEIEIHEKTTTAGYTRAEAVEEQAQSQAQRQAEEQGQGQEQELQKEKKQKISQPIPSKDSRGNTNPNPVAEFSFPRPRTSMIISSSCQQKAKIKKNNLLKSPSSQIDSGHEQQ